MPRTKRAESANKKLERKEIERTEKLYYIIKISDDNIKLKHITKHELKHQYEVAYRSDSFQKIEKDEYKLLANCLKTIYAEEDTTGQTTVTGESFTDVRSDGVGQLVLTASEKIESSREISEGVAQKTSVEASFVASFDLLKGVIDVQAGTKAEIGFEIGNDIIKLKPSLVAELKASVSMEPGKLKATLEAKLGVQVTTEVLIPLGKSDYVLHLTSSIGAYIKGTLGAEVTALGSGAEGWIGATIEGGLGIGLTRTITGGDVNLGGGQLGVELSAGFGFSLGTPIISSTDIKQPDVTESTSGGTMKVLSLKWDVKVGFVGGAITVTLKYNQDITEYAEILKEITKWIKNTVILAINEELAKLAAKAALRIEEAKLDVRTYGNLGVSKIDHLLHKHKGEIDAKIQYHKAKLARLQLKIDEDTKSLAKTDKKLASLQAKIGDVLDAVDNLSGDDFLEEIQACARILESADIESDAISAILNGRASMVSSGTEMIEGEELKKIKKDLAKARTACEKQEVKQKKKKDKLEEDKNNYNIRLEKMNAYLEDSYINESQRLVDKIGELEVYIQSLDLDNLSEHKREKIDKKIAKINKVSDHLDDIMTRKKILVELAVADGLDDDILDTLSAHNKEMRQAKRMVLVQVELINQQLEAIEE